MASYANIINGKVFEIITWDPTGRYRSNLVWVLIPAGLVVAQGWLYSNGTFSPPPAPPGPTLALQAVALLADGLTVTSTANGALNATYATDQTSQLDVIAIETSLNAGQGFPPNNATTFAYPDRAGNQHTFTQSDFTNLAAAIRNFVYACKAVIGGTSTTLPPATATIP